MKVSIIIPCRNEATRIGPCLESIIGNGFPHENIEVLVVDGLSEDQTRSIVLRYSEKFPFIHLMDNPKKITPAAINVGISASKGSVLMRMDAHACYEKGYISKCVEALAGSGADNVGGVLRTRPMTNAPMARAIALGMSHPFGVGNSYFRIGSSLPRWVDTVPFGCYRREIFEQIGFFDEDLPRNQDDEFNARMLKHGKKILLVPDIVSDYYPRDSLGKLWGMYYQYGYYKPLAAWKVGKITTVRQLIPAAFVGCVVIGFFLSPILTPVQWALGTLLTTYASVIVMGALHAVRRSRENFSCAARLFFVFPTLHFSYGLGYIHGFWLLARTYLRGRRKSSAPSVEKITANG